MYIVATLIWFNQLFWCAFQNRLYYDKLKMVISCTCQFMWNGMITILSWSVVFRNLCWDRDQFSSVMRLMESVDMTVWIVSSGVRQMNFTIFFGISWLWRKDTHVEISRYARIVFSFKERNIHVRALTLVERTSIDCRLYRFLICLVSSFFLLTS